MSQTHRDKNEPPLGSWIFRAPAYDPSEVIEGGPLFYSVDQRTFYTEDGTQRITKMSFLMADPDTQENIRSRVRQKPHGLEINCTTPPFPSDSPLDPTEKGP